MTVALVTGGSRGIGRSICIALAADGCDLVAVGRDPEALARTRRQVEAQGRGCMEAICDVLEPSQIERTMTAVMERFGRIDILVNNAGQGSNDRPPAAESMPESQWERSLRLNLTAAYIFCRHAIVPMKAARRGAIINIASVAGRQASYLSDIAYTAAKSGVVGLTRHLARELGPFGIRVNTVAPGIVASERVKRKFDDLADAEREGILGRVPLRRIGTVEEVASCVAFLASDKASYVHGAILDVNGGLFMP